MTLMDLYFRAVRLSVRLIEMRKHEDGRKMFQTAERLDKLMYGGIIEKRYNDGSHYTKDEHGRFTGSTSSGGGSGSSGGGFT